MSWYKAFQLRKLFNKRDVYEKVIENNKRSIKYFKRQIKIITKQINDKMEEQNEQL